MSRRIFISQNKSTASIGIVEWQPSTGSAYITTSFYDKGENYYEATIRNGWGSGWLRISIGMMVGKTVPYRINGLLAGDIYFDGGGAADVYIGLYGGGLSFSTTDGDTEYYFLVSMYT